MRTLDSTRRRRAATPLTLLAVCLALSACVEAKPFAYDTAGEIPSGPGLLTGQKGKFILYREDESGRAEYLK